MITNNLIPPNPQIIGEVPAEFEIASTVTSNVLPTLRSILSTLQALKLAWNSNEIPSLIEQATLEEKMIAGFLPEVWVAWGQTLQSFDAWLETPIESISEKPITVLTKRYARQQELI
jgi:hypothetical protein